jgi:hypothetical protein
MVKISQGAVTTRMKTSATRRQIQRSFECWLLTRGSHVTCEPVVLYSARNGHFEVQILSAYQEKIPARNAIYAHAQDFSTGDEMLLAILKAFIPQPLNKQDNRLPCVLTNSMWFNVEHYHNTHSTQYRCTHYTLLSAARCFQSVCNSVTPWCVILFSTNSSPVVHPPVHFPLEPQQNRQPPPPQAGTFSWNADCILLRS